MQGAQHGSLDCTVCMRVAWLYHTCSCWGSLKAADLETHSGMYPQTQMYAPKWNTCTLRGGTWPSQHNCPESPWPPVLPLLVSLARQDTKTRCKQHIAGLPHPGWCWRWPKKRESFDLYDSSRHGLWPDSWSGRRNCARLPSWECRKVNWCNSVKT